ncbi:hypothetical protein GcC1_024042, partial [Golovinomyces cichoracearum]
MYLVTEYKKDTAYALVYQVGTLCQLITAYSTSKTLSEIIQLFEIEWNKLFHLTFAAVKQHLLDIDYEEVSDTALATGSTITKKPVLSRPSGIVKSYNKTTCSYCKKHYPKSNLNHHWYK